MRKNNIVTNSTSFGLNMRSGIKVVFTYVFVVLLICLVIRMSFSAEPITFYSLLTWLQSFNNTGIQSVFANIANGIQSLSISTLPSVNIFGVTLGFSWISDIWNFFLNIEGVVVWLAGNLVYAINFLIQLFRFVFVF